MSNMLRGALYWMALPLSREGNRPNAPGIMRRQELETPMAAADDTYLDDAYDEGLDHAHAGEIVEWYAKRPVTVSTAAATGSLVAAFALGALTAVGTLFLLRQYDER